MPAPLHTAGYPQAIVDRVLDAATAVPGALAIAGVQGSGKSTLAAQVARSARERGLRVALLSLDDVYLDRPARLALAHEVHPLLATRGPPGTHDLPLALDVLARLRDGGRVRLPRFDKRSDRRIPESAWPWVDGADLTIVDGWCLHVPAEADDALATPLNDLERDEDPDGTWRRWCNRALRDAYPPLWSMLPSPVLLQAPSFDVVPGWRWEQECSAHEAAPARPCMSRAQVDRFVRLFERVSRHALRTLPPMAHLRVVLDARRRPVAVHARNVPDDAPPTIGG